MQSSRSRPRGLLARALATPVVGAAILAGAPATASAAPCATPSAQPAWADFADGSVAFRQQVFGRPGIIAATAGGGIAGQMIAAGATGAYWEMNLPDYVGTPAAPAPADEVTDNADYLHGRAVRAAGCDTPWITLNELLVPNAAAPFVGSNLRYRSNVLQLVKHLAAYGDRVFLLIPPSGPNTRDSGARAYWRRISKVSDIVLEAYYSAPAMSAVGPLLASRDSRIDMRRRLDQMRAIGVPVSRLGLMLGFQGRQGGRMGLQPTGSWLDFVKLQTLAARQVAAEIPIATIWSWGWRTSGLETLDPDKQAAACVYLWTRDPGLCDAPATASFDTSVTEGQIILPAGASCTTAAGATITDAATTRWGTILHSSTAARTLLLGRIASAAIAVPAPYLSRTESGVVAREFGGSRPAYRAFLLRAGITRTEARLLLLDGIHTNAYAASSGVPTIAATEVRAWYRSHLVTLVRPVRSASVRPELGGRASGFALDGSFASRAVHARLGARATLATATGPFTLRSTGPAVRLRSVRLGKAAPTIRALLARQVQASRGAAAEASAQRATVDAMTCLGDDLPSPGLQPSSLRRLVLD